MDICKEVSPQPLDLDGHMVRCHAVEQEVGQLVSIKEPLKASGGANPPGGDDDQHESEG
jgi:hypothetical protein